MKPPSLGQSLVPPATVFQGRYKSRLSYCSFQNVAFWRLRWALMSAAYTPLRAEVVLDG